MKLVWTVGARSDLSEIGSHIWQDNPAAARQMRDCIQRKANHLKSHPFMGRPGVVAGTREVIPHPSHRLVHQASENLVSILSVLHTSRQWPPATDEDDA